MGLPGAVFDPFSSWSYWSGCPVAGFVLSRWSKLKAWLARAEFKTQYEGGETVRLRLRYAVTGFVQNRVLNGAWCRRRASITARSSGPWLRPLDGWLNGWMDRGGLEPSAGSDGTPREKRASNPQKNMVPEAGVEPARPYGQGILSPSISSIDHNSGHVSPC